MTTLNLVASILAIIASICSIYITNNLRQKIEIKLKQYDAMSSMYDEIISITFKFEYYADELVLKYQLSDMAGLESKISPEEQREINNLRTQINILLSKMFILLPDVNYKRIREIIIPNQRYTIKDLREEFLVTIRKSLHPQTKFSNKEDIRYILK